MTKTGLKLKYGISVDKRDVLGDLSQFCIFNILVTLLVIIQGVSKRMFDSEIILWEAYRDFVYLKNLYMMPGLL